MPQSDYNVNINITAKDKASAAAQKAAKGIKLLDGVMMAAGSSALALAKQIPKAAVEMVKMGAEANRQASALDNLARGAGTSGDAIVRSMQEASGYTIDRMAAMSAANRAMVMDVAKSPQEFERLTKVAVALGRAMGQDATKSIDDFVTASARQSQMIADNLGLTVTVGQATERYAEKLGVTADQLTDAQKKQAFLNMMLEEGEKKMAELGGTNADLASDFEMLRATFKDATTDIAMMTAETIASSGALHDWALTVREATETAREQMQAQREAKAEWDVVYEQATKAERAEMRRVRSAEERAAVLEKVSERIQRRMMLEGELTQEMEESALAQQALNSGTMYQTSRMSELNYVSDETKESLKEQVTSQGMLMHTVLQAAESLEQESAAMDKFVGGMDAAQQLSLSMSFTRQLESMAETSQQFATRREEIEAQHQEKIAELQKRGQATAIQLNVQAEQQKLADLQYRMEQAQRKVDEMTGKEKESSRIAKEHALEVARERYAAQEQLLADYHAGRLIAKGENVAGMIDLANQEKDAQIAALDEQIAKQAQLQKQQEAQMYLQAFDMWADQKDIPVEKMLEMRTAIAEQYGLVNEGTTELVTDMVSEWDNWAQGAGASTDELVSYMDAIITEQGKVKADLVDLTAQEWVIKVRYEMSGRPESAGGGTGLGTGAGVGAGIPQFQHGGSFIVGEGGAEMVTVQPLGGTTNTYNETINVYHPGAMAAHEETRRRRRATMGRTM